MSTFKYQNVVTGRMVAYAAARMKTGSIVCLGILSLATGLLDGCASNGSGAAAGAATAQKKGHWVTLPPQIGSLIPQRIWVEDNGEANSSGSMNNVQNGSAADVQRMQNIPHSFKPPGS